MQKELRLSKEQRKALSEVFGASRFVYNVCLNLLERRGEIKGGVEGAMRFCAKLSMKARGFLKRQDMTVCYMAYYDALTKYERAYKNGKPAQFRKRRCEESAVASADYLNKILGADLFESGKYVRISRAGGGAVKYKYPGELRGEVPGSDVTWEKFGFKSGSGRSGGTRRSGRSEGTGRSGTKRSVCGGYENKRRSI